MGRIFASARARRRLVAGAWVVLLAWTGPPGYSRDDSNPETRTRPRLIATTPTAETGPVPDSRLHPRATYVWPFMTGPHYGHVPGADRRDPGVLVTRVGSFRLDGRPLPLPEPLTTPAESTRYFVILLDPSRVDRETLAALRHAVESTGGAILRHMPVSATIARVPHAGRAALREVPGIVAIEPYHAAWKLDPTIGRLPHLDPERALSDEYELDVLLFPGESPADAAAQVAEIGGAVEWTYPDRLVVRLHRASLARLATIDAVEAVFEHRPPHLMGQETTEAIQTGRTGPGADPYHAAGVRGASQVLGVIDNGLQLDAADLSDTDVSPGVPGPEHRKVRFYATAEAAGGSGDLAGCDAPAQGGVTHGHFVTAIAIGNAEHAGRTFEAVDPTGRTWSLNGVAPDARVAFLDAQRTPAAGVCGEPTPAHAGVPGILDPGDLYDSTGDTGGLAALYAESARVLNLSFGDLADVYGAGALDIDAFLAVRPDALVTVPSGNHGSGLGFGGLPPPSALSDLATSKNAIVVGAHGAVHEDPALGLENRRAAFSSVGPAGVTDRVAPLLMAPGFDDRDLPGLASGYACRTGDNDQTGAVTCDIATGREGTSYASAAVAGAALLVRDWFAQGFHPDASGTNPDNDADRVENVSGALVKAVLIASAERIGETFLGTRGADQVYSRERFTPEQGYGRVQLDRALPLTGWPAAPDGLLAVDGGLGEEPPRLFDFGAGLPGRIDAAGGEAQGATFAVCNDTIELRVALAWTDEPGDALVNDLDLELISPSGRLYFGNYFTEDDDRDGVLDPLTEDCPSLFVDEDPTTTQLLPAQNPGIDRSQWSLATCVRGDGSRPPHDRVNPTEAIYLSPNPQGDVGPGGIEILRGGTCEPGGTPCGHDGHCSELDVCVGGTSQVEAGTWSIRVLAQPGGADPEQTYALVVSGGVCSGSSLRLARPEATCADALELTVQERDERADPANGLDAAEIASRTMIEVIDTNGVVVDAEPGTGFPFARIDPVRLAFTGSGIPTSDGLARASGNGLLDVRSGDTIRAIYADESGGVPDPNRRRTAEARVDCRPRIVGGQVEFAQIGRDVPYVVTGGCERSYPAGLVEYGFPDRYMDSGETVGYRLAFASLDEADLEEATAELRCVEVDGDSPPGCRPESTDCPDPRRENNPPCRVVHVLDSPKDIGTIAARSANAAHFVVRVDEHTGTSDVEMVLSIRGTGGGRTQEAIVVQRHRVNVEEIIRFYSTDYPLGGVEYLDENNNGRIENPRRSSLPGADFVLETRAYSDPTACYDDAGNPIVCNDGLQSPWNFDTNDGGFRSGLHAETDWGRILDTIANWGEDLNFNGVLDGRCQAAPDIACDRYPQDPVHCPVEGDFVCVNEEDRDPVNFPVPLLDRNWSTQGGCGWQTKAPGTCSEDPSIGCYADDDCSGSGTCTGSAPATGGVWHTGSIRDLVQADCIATGGANGQCQSFETIDGTEGRYVWWEMLLTPVIEKVDKALDADGQARSTVEVTNWAFNAAVDLPDNRVSFNLRFDTDVDRLEPVDPVTDPFEASIWNAVGPYGAISGGNPELTRGFSLFAPIDPATQTSWNGTSGGDRQGDNSCWFEGGSVPRERLDRIGLAGPPDDDAPEGYCPSGRVGFGFSGPDPPLQYCTTVCEGSPGTACATAEDCRGTCINPGLAGFCRNDANRTCSFDSECDFGACVDVLCNGTCVESACTNSGASCGSDADCAEACVFTQATIDTFVRPNGPVRNVQISDFDGPDMRFVTLEDRYGTTGNRFQGALGFRVEEAPTSPEARTGYGLAVDDMVVTWREFRLEEDSSYCPGTGACAVVELDTTHILDATARLGVSVGETTPSDNDCDLDGTSDATRDCNGNGIDDVVVLVTSAEEPDGEIVIADRVTPGFYRGFITVSLVFDAPGVLRAAAGFRAVTIEAVYRDLDDGTGRPCPNSVDETLHGRVSTTADLQVQPVDVVVTRHRLEDNGDHDGWADGGETVSMFVEVWNRSDTAATGLSLRAASSSPGVACITRPFLELGTLEPGERRFSDTGIEFIVGAERTDAAEDLTATFDYRLATDRLATVRQQSLTLDLDLDASGGAGPTVFLDGFEDGDLGTFEPMPIDDDLNPPDGDLGNYRLGVQNADGHRCQYSDPDWPLAGVHGSSQAAFCFPNPNLAPDAFFWQTIDERAFSGNRSLHWGAFLDEARGYSTPTAQLEAVSSKDPVNLGWASVCEVDRALLCQGPEDCPPAQRCVATGPQLSLKHQVSFMDHRALDAQFDRGPERGVVQAQVADPDGEPIGHWIKLYPFVNGYDSQANTNFFNCTFDPIDDGNTEDDFFDPASPTRTTGPSSTCYPEFSFIDQGVTTDELGPGFIGDALDGPALQGASGPGNWVEPVFDLNRFRGRRIRLRFLATSLKLGGFVTWDNAFVFNPDRRDDGWFIDDVTITDALVTPATIGPDLKDNGHLPSCGTDCSGVVAALGCVRPASSPGTCPALVAPGASVELSAAGSSFERCPSGVLEHRFWLDADRDGRAAGPTDVLLRDWTADATLFVTPAGTTGYVVETRCAGDASCTDVPATQVAVGCPLAGDSLGPASGTDGPFLQRNPRDARSLAFRDRSTLVWPTAATVDVVRGRLDALRENGGLSGSNPVCLLDDGIAVAALVDATAPPPGTGWYYLARSAEFCNLAAGGSWGGSGEDGDRDAALATGSGSCED